MRTLIFILLMILVSCQKREFDPITLQKLENYEDVWYVWRSIPVDVYHHGYWSDTTLLLDFPCYDIDMGQWRAVAGRGTLFYNNKEVELK